MAIASLKLSKCTGAAAATETDCSKHPCFLGADLSSTDTGAYPVKAPATVVSNPTYSYECWLRWELTSPPDNYLQNLKWWGPAHRPDYEDSPGNKLTVYAGLATSGVTPVNTQSSVATTRQDTNYYQEGNALAITVVPGDGKLNAVGEKSNYLVLQLKVEYQAKQGIMASQVFNLTYEEV